jgi:predicted MFS family arabinose efflux permease
MARAVCGLGAGGAMSLGQIINSDLVPLERRASYMALLNLAYGTGSSLGAALGGFLADALGWRWEFGIQVPAITLCFVIACFTTPAGLGPNFAKHGKGTLWQTVKGFDLAGSFLLTSSVTFLVLALNLGGNILPWDHPIIISAFVLFGVLGGILIVVETHAEKPVLPLHMLYNVPRGNLVISNFFACMTMNTILFNVPLYFQATLLDTPTRSGTRLIVPFLCNMGAAFITGNLITYTRRLSPTMVLGYVLTVLGSIFLTTMTRSLPAWAYSWLIATATIGQGSSFPTVSIAILAVTHAQDMAVATSTLILFRSLGTVMGVAVSSLVSQNALVYYLEKIVVGEERDAVIKEARRSVEAIVNLTPFYREQGRFSPISVVVVRFANLVRSDRCICRRNEGHVRAEYRDGGYRTALGPVHPLATTEQATHGQRTSRLMPVGIPRPPYLMIVVLVRQHVSVLAFTLFNTLYIGLPAG